MKNAFTVRSSEAISPVLDPSRRVPMPYTGAIEAMARIADIDLTANSPVPSWSQK